MSESKTEKVTEETLDVKDVNTETAGDAPVEEQPAHPDKETKPEVEKEEGDDKAQTDKKPDDKDFKFTNRPRKHSRKVQQKLQEQSLEIAALRDQNKAIIESLKELGNENVPENKPAQTPSTTQTTVSPDDQKVIEKWTADLDDAKESEPDVFDTIKKIQRGRHSISYLDPKTHTALLAEDGLSPFDIHDLSVNFKDELEVLVEKNLTSRGELRQIRKWLDEQEAGQAENHEKAKKSRKVAPKPTGKLKGTPEITHRQTPEKEVKSIHSKAGLS